MEKDDVLREVLFLEYGSNVREIVRVRDKIVRVRDEIVRKQDRIEQEWEV